MLVVLHLPRKCTGLRNILLFLLLTRSRRLDIQNALLMTFIYEIILNSTVCLMRWGSGTDTSLFTDSLGNLDKFNTFRFALPIRRQVGGYRSRTETLFVLLRSEILNLP